MPYTPAYAAGDVLTAAAMNSIGEAWSTFTVTWTGSITNPVINNGTLTGYYQQINKTVLCKIKMVAGSSTTFGSGYYRFSLPVTARSTYATNDPLGRAIFTDLNTQVYSGTVCIDTTARVLMYAPVAFSNDSLVGSTHPFTFANGDSISIEFVYEAA